MRIKALLVLTALSAVASPAFAQRSCAEVRQNNQIGGAIVGGILGGVLGSNVAASGHRHDGTALGAVVGGMIGAGAGGNIRCSPPPQGYGYGYGPGSGYDPNPNYGGPYYGDRPSGYGYSSGPLDGGYSSPRYADDRDWGDDRSHRSSRDGLYPRQSGAYNAHEDFAGEDCSETIQITRMPDGTERHRPVQVCRNAYYGEWQVRD